MSGQTLGICQVGDSLVQSVTFVNILTQTNVGINIENCMKAILVRDSASAKLVTTVVRSADISYSIKPIQLEENSQ